MRRYRVKLQRVEYQEDTVEVEVPDGASQEEIALAALTNSDPDFQCISANEEMLAYEEAPPKPKKCNHEADPLSMSVAQEASTDESLHFVVDVNCKHCGRSGSARVDTDDITWG